MALPSVTSLNPQPSNITSARGPLNLDKTLPPKLQVVSCKPRYWLLVIGYWLLVIGCKPYAVSLLPITYYLLPITYYLLPITYYLLPTNS